MGLGKSNCSYKLYLKIWEDIILHMYEQIHISHINFPYKYMFRYLWSLLLSLFKSNLLWKLIDDVPELHHSSELQSWMCKSLLVLVINKFNSVTLLLKYIDWSTFGLDSVIELLEDPLSQIETHEQKGKP